MDEEKRGWLAAGEYAPDDIEAQDDFMSGWRAAIRDATHRPCGLPHTAKPCIGCSCGDN